MSYIPKPHEIYKHFKGNLYQIMAIAEHSETGEQLVVYQALYDDYKIFARPLAMFMEKLDKQKAVWAGQDYRFELQSMEQKEKSSITERPKEAVEESQELPDLDPMVLAFLDADSYEERLNILVGIRHRMTDDMLTTMAIACDVELPEGALEERYEGLRNCLVTLQKYECNRLR